MVNSVVSDLGFSPGSTHFQLSEVTLLFLDSVSSFVPSRDNDGIGGLNEIHIQKVYTKLVLLNYVIAASLF